MMKVRPYLWWILGGIFLFLCCVGFVGFAYYFGWSATGFLNKSLWDWLQLLIVPLALAAVASMFQLSNTRTERQIAQQRYLQDQAIAKQRYEQDLTIAEQRYEQDQQIALDKQHEDLLQTYLDRISELLLKENLRTSPSEEVRNVARVRTITVLTQLNARRIGYVFTFLREAGLMPTASTDSVVSLKDADLHAVKWDQARLIKANLSDARLIQADLTKAILIDANLSGASLTSANLSGAMLTHANLSKARLTHANLSKARLPRANLSKARLSDTDLSDTDLSDTDLSGADLSGANLSDANLSGANLSDADLSDADLSKANVTEEQLKSANLLTGATMPDGSKHS